MNLRDFIGNKSNTHQALWIGIGSLSSFALAIVSAAILSRYFDKAEYGTYRQILYVYNTLLVIFTAGLPSVFAYFLPRFNLAQGKDIVLKVSKVLFLGGLIFSIFLFAFSEIISIVLKNPELSTGLKYFSPIPMLLLPTLGIEGIFSTYKKTIFIAIYNILTRILMLIFIVLPVIILKGSYLYAIYGWLAVSVITFTIAYFFKGIPFKGLTAEPSGLSIKDIFAYCVPLAVASLAGIAIKASYQFYISRYFGAEVFAEYSNGFIELPFVGMITSATATVLMPLFSKMVHERTDVNQMISLWQNTLQKSAILIYPMVIFFMIFAKEVMVILYSSKYLASSVYFTIAMSINFFNVIVFAPLLLSLGETRFYAQLHFWFAVSAWFLGYLVIIIFNCPIAIAIFSALQSICTVFVAFIFTSRLLKIKFIRLFPVGELLKIGLHSLVFLIVVKFAVNYLLPKMNEPVTLIISFVSFVFILILSSPLFKIKYLNIIKPFINK